MIHLLDPTARDTDPAPPTPTTVADAVTALTAAHDGTGQYPDDLVDVLLRLVDAAAADTAAAERARYAAWLGQTARNGFALDEGVRAGLRLAATHLDRDLATTPDGDQP